MKVSNILLDKSLKFAKITVRKGCSRRSLYVYARKKLTPLMMK